MSRGPGRVQRYILDELVKARDEHPDKVTMRWCWGNTLVWGFTGLDSDAAVEDDAATWPTRSQGETVYRACRQLAKAGKVEIGYGHLYAGNTSIGREMRVRLPLTPEEAEAEADRDRQNLERLLGKLG